jgi:hypothetical protein
MCYILEEALQVLRFVEETGPKHSLQFLPFFFELCIEDEV